VTETNVFELTQPGTFSDPLTEVCNGARTLLGQAVEAEVAAWLSAHFSPTPERSSMPSTMIRTVAQAGAN
jgi:hypothetical protein